MNLKALQTIASGLMMLACTVGIIVGAVNGTRETNHNIRTDNKAKKAA